MTEDKFQVFVSHKQDDHALAKTVKTTLERLCGSSIYCFVSGSDIAAGSDWNAEIRSQLAKSHLLILLFTEPSRNWDWCLYEAGLFTSLGAAEEHSVVCLYRPPKSPADNALPSPLRNLQGVPVAPEPLQEFLRQLCKETWRVAKEWRRGPLVPEDCQTSIVDTSNEILKAFSQALPGVDKEELIYHPCHRIVLDLSSIEKIEAGIPREALVVEGDRTTSNFTLTLFNLAAGRLPRTWGQLVDAAGVGDTTWLTDLNQRFAAALQEELFVPSTSTIELRDTWRQHRRSYRVILYQIVREGQLRSGAGASPAPPGRPRQVTIVLDPVLGTNQGDPPTARPGATPQT